MHFDIFGHLLSMLFMLKLLSVASAFEDGISEYFRLRHSLQSSPQKTVSSFCRQFREHSDRQKIVNFKLILRWKKNGTYVDVCLDHLNQSNYVPRYYQLGYKIDLKLANQQLHYPQKLNIFYL
jgi:hypothetical protein